MIWVVFLLSILAVVVIVIVGSGWVLKRIRTLLDAVGKDDEPC